MLVDDISAVLAERPGRTASEVAAAMDGGKGERVVSLALFAHHGWFRCDRGDPPRWWLVTNSSRGATGPVAAAPQPQAGWPEEASRPAAGIECRPGPASAGPPANVSGLAAGIRRPLGPAPFVLYQWQADALAAWARHHRRGVVEAVTGTGKTVVGIAAALQEIGDREQVLVLVPTVELQRQWVAQLTARLPARTRIGRLGDGAHDRLASHDVLVAVVNSAPHPAGRVAGGRRVPPVWKCRKPVGARPSLQPQARFERHLRP